ncbi:flavodoxin family protein [Fusicatenibacter saccharivorans]|uniref:flavodoxin family protein n=1 Tax=Fusicatenibacter saccharivorans TaxID=1150298 RepID=UPI001D4D4540|nr:flavodoxin family protein [Fusicatenibacter saccharivorans]NSD94071.1 flavodoxin family protein [Fusicatenibacter saccharivorans]NSD97261.1 flavodoxin family protein [Fusicatenibacter saccharivorans]NSE00507.1 flavodoxin family protein [Fusicatenibacter saccharivorans]NSE07176.1 flavodoxin family protein [Fusicatenibacter saccharivorans]
MKVLLVNGSPHREGCTYTALCAVSEALNQNGIDTDTFWIGNKPISGCIACHKCNDRNRCVFEDTVNDFLSLAEDCNGVQREHNKKLNNGLPILHKVPPKRDYGRYFCIMAEKGGTSHGDLTEKLSLFFHAKKQEVNAYGR